MMQIEPPKPKRPCKYLDSFHQDDKDGNPQAVLWCKAFKVDLVKQNRRRPYTCARCIVYKPAEEKKK